MLQIDQQFDLNDQELVTIKELSDAPLEITVHYLCQEDAENLIPFTLNKLGDLNTTIGILSQNFDIQVLHRRNPSD